MNFVIYETATGSIVQFCTTPNRVEVERILAPGQACAPAPAGATQATHYVHGSMVVPRPASPVVLDGLTLRGLIGPGTICINNQPYPCDANQVSLGFDQPGPHHVRVACWPYQDKEFDVAYPAL